VKTQQLACVIGILGEVGEKAEVVVDVVVTPAPLVAGDQHGDIGVGGILHLDQGLGGGYRHAHQDEEGDDRPDDLDGGVLMEVGGLGAERLAVVDDRPDHRTEDNHTDDDTNPENQHVQAVDFLADLGDAARHVERRRGGPSGVGGE
jgi:hypothetical protein